MFYKWTNEVNVLKFLLALILCLIPSVLNTDLMWLFSRGLYKGKEFNHVLIKEHSCFWQEVELKKKAKGREAFYWGLKQRKKKERRQQGREERKTWAGKRSGQMLPRSPPRPGLISATSQVFCCTPEISLHAAFFSASCIIREVLLNFKITLSIFILFQCFKYHHSQSAMEKKVKNMSFFFCFLSLLKKGKVW